MRNLLREDAMWGQAVSRPMCGCGKRHAKSSGRGIIARCEGRLPLIRSRHAISRCDARVARCCTWARWLAVQLPVQRSAAALIQPRGSADRRCRAGAPGTSAR